MCDLEKQFMEDPEFQQSAELALAASASGGAIETQGAASKFGQTSLSRSPVRGTGGATDMKGKKQASVAKE